MKKMIYYVPAVCALLLYLILGVMAGFGAINTLVWFWLGIMFLSAVVMAWDKWYGCIGGVIVGCVLIIMSAQYTGQVLDLERPLGILLCSYYLICGLAGYRKSKYHADSE